ncbi:mitochondrial outer membrane protein SLC25A46-like isoform X2 [Dermacentor andersoni]|uniref:mitochondrial outer membrane protein SLC25A46-like isoform X2 n=1 Tax=Dermacentor andersoni TaxID=34620 RepID=UPI00215570B7|nr:mitochondrial outer membrane protein SLC25A46-like isoform X2 [Dermacentor andersoni]
MQPDPQRTQRLLSGTSSSDYARDGELLRPIPELTVGPSIRARTHYDYPQIAPSPRGDGDRPTPPKEPEPVQPHSEVALRLGSILLDNLVAQPCIVLRRQCQVHRTASKYHLTPWTLFPIIARLQQRQGLITLWKGAPSMFIVRGIVVVVETVLAETTSLPRELTSHSSLRQLWQHLLLKSVAVAVATPFSCASLVEVVQCEAASERPGLFDCLREGLMRLLPRGGPKRGRMLPLWRLLGASVAHGLAHYLLTTMVRWAALQLLRMHRHRQHQQVLLLRQQAGIVHGPMGDALELPSEGASFLQEMVASLIGSLVADVLLFPFETVLHRLYLQGTRTIVDNLDTGCSVTAIISQYQGPVDCFRCIVAEEGAAGLYKGFGALQLQYMLQGALLKLTQMLCQEFCPHVL